MASPDPFLFFTRIFGELRIPYLVSGSVASTFYGEPRMTYDVDIILFLKAEDVPRLESAFPPQQFYCPPGDAIRAELERSHRGHFNLIHHATGFKADIYLSGSDPLHAWALERVRKVDFDGEVLALAPPEYVILRKLQFYREGRSTKHLRDIFRMLAGLGANCDRAALEKLIEEHGLAAEWAAAQAHSGS
jgi:hypothetical protein